MFHFFFPWVNFARKFPLPLNSKDQKDVEVRSEYPEAVKEEPLPEDVMDDIAVNSGSGDVDVPREDVTAAPEATDQPAPEEAASEETAPEEPAPNPISLEGEKVKLWGFEPDGPEADTITSAGGKVMVGVGKTTTLVVTNGPITPGMEDSKTWERIQDLRAEGSKIGLIEWSELKARLEAA